MRVKVKGVEIELPDDLDVEIEGTKVKILGRRSETIFPTPLPNPGPVEYPGWDPSPYWRITCGSIPASSSGTVGLAQED